MSKPIETIRDKDLKVAIFRNTGKNGVFFSLHPSRIYTDEQGQIHETTSLSGYEPLRLAHLLLKGQDRKAVLEAAEKEAAEQAG